MVVHKCPSLILMAMVWKKCLLKETENTEAVSKNVLFLFVYYYGDHMVR